MVDAELGLMEGNARQSRQNGGYYLTLHQGGGLSESHPALASGEAPFGSAYIRSTVRAAPAVWRSAPAPASCLRCPSEELPPCPFWTTFIPR